MKQAGENVLSSIQWLVRWSLGPLIVFLLMACEGPQETPSENPDQHSYLQRDVRDDIFYFVLPDRFENGNPDNDQGSKTIAISRGGFDPGSTGHYHGGDLAGLESRLDYLQALGITAIWLTPILRNNAVQGDSSGYHGYWVLDFTEIDPHLGTNTDLKRLIDNAHKRDIKVFFDIITNHTADIIKYRECHHPDGSLLDEENPGCDYKSRAQLAAGDSYTPFVPVATKDVKVPSWLNDPKHYHNQGDTVWQGESVVNGDFSGLDDIDTRSDFVLQGFIDIYTQLITQFRPDGYRIDTVKHVDMSFWQQFTPAILAHAHAQGIPNFHIFGEVYNEDPVFLSRYTTLGKTPAVLDFAFQLAATDVMIKGESPRKLQKLFEDDDYYNDADSSAALNPSFTGTHDMGRIGMFLNRDLPEASDDEKLRRSALTHALMFFSRGIPIIYYGDEQGFTGDGNDRGAREDMMPSLVDSYNDNILLGTDATTAQSNFDTTHPLFRTFTAFTELYKEHQALRRGIHLNRYADDSAGIYAFSRVDPQEKIEYLLVFNSDVQARSIALPATSESYSPVYFAREALQATQGEVSIHLEGLSFAIYRADTGMPETENLQVKVLRAGRDTDPRSENVIAIDYALAAENGQALPLLKVSTEILRVDGKYHVVAHDFTPPYRARLRGEIRDDKQHDYKIRVTVDNLGGQKQSAEFEFSL